MKRIVLLVMTNVAIMVVLSVVAHLLGQAALPELTLCA